MRDIANKLSGISISIEQIMREIELYESKIEILKTNEYRSVKMQLYKYNSNEFDSFNIRDISLFKQYLINEYTKIIEENKQEIDGLKKEMIELVGQI